MSPPSPPSFSSLSLILFSFFLAIHGQNLIYDTCKSCSKQDPNVKFQFCNSSLESAPNSRHADLRGLGMISINLTQHHLTDTRRYIKHLLKNNTRKIDPRVRPCLDDCLQLYSDAIPTIKEAAKNYDSKRYFDANIQISAVMDDATTCEDEFKEEKGIVSPLGKRNNATFQLSAMVLSIMHILQNGDIELLG